MRTFLPALLAGVLLVGPTWADRNGGHVGEYAVIDNGEGIHRCLFKAEGLGNLQSVAISHAQLEFDIPGQVVDRRLHLRICPVTTPWSPASVDWTSGWRHPGGDFDADLSCLARIDLSRTGRKAVFDLTPILREWLDSGAQYQGFILTTQERDGEGIEGDDMSRLEGLQNASVTVSYRKVLRVPRELLRG